MIIDNEREKRGVLLEALPDAHRKRLRLNGRGRRGAAAIEVKNGADVKREGNAHKVSGFSQYW
ncbi:MAG TPA: hypothetical protein VFW23_07360, partial [Tepidisphaeraceae bacterium]|nr:hypothetical protein [Tepidisphaeraceae bacterium]